MPAQITWRADEALIARLRMHAEYHGLSMNEFITRVMKTVTDPTYAASESERVRERLLAAGLLVEFETDPSLDNLDSAALDWAEVEAAADEAAHGTPLSDLVIEGR